MELYTAYPHLLAALSEMTTRWQQRLRVSAQSRCLNRQQGAVLPFRLGPLGTEEG